MAIAIVFHLIAVVHFYFGFIYDRIYITEPDSKWRGYEFGGRLSEREFLSFSFKFLIILFFFLVYLTLWNVVCCNFINVLIVSKIFSLNINR
jgi:hypothetical protein